MASSQEIRSTLLVLFALSCFVLVRSDEDSEEQKWERIKNLKGAICERTADQKVQNVVHRLDSLLQCISGKLEGLEETDFSKCVSDPGKSGVGQVLDRLCNEDMNMEHVKQVYGCVTQNIKASLSQTTIRAAIAQVIVAAQECRNGPAE